MQLQQCMSTLCYVLAIMQDFAIRLITQWPLPGRYMLTRQAATA